jgi:hypothetical protein
MSKNMGIGEDPYERLANAIILQAVEDYRADLKKLEKDPVNQDVMQDALSIERFFRSGWYAGLTGVDGEYLIGRLRKEIAAKK